MTWRPTCWYRRRAAARAVAHVPATTNGPPARVSAALAAADIQLAPAAAWRLWGRSLLVTAGCGWVIAGVAGGLTGAVATVVGPAVVLAALRHRRDERISRELPGALERTAAALRAGSSLRLALAEAAADQPPPLRDDLTAIVEAAHRGAPLASACTRWASARPVPAVRLAAAALSLAAETGGGAAQSLDGVASSLRDRLGAAGEARTFAAQSRASAVVMVVAPVAFALVTVSVDPRAAGFLLGSSLGGLCLLAGVGLDVAGALWMAAIVRRASGSW